jgi:hypothetical protein
LGGTDLRSDRRRRHQSQIVREGKEKLPRRFGQFLHHMQKSRSWGALYLHLYDVRDLLEPARAWAAETSHRLASAYSVESLLKLVSDFEQRDNPIPPKQPKSAKKVVSNGATVANLSKIDAHTDEFVAVVVEQANGDLAEIARIFQSTVHDLIAQIRSEL